MPSEKNALIDTTGVRKVRERYTPEVGMGVRRWAWQAGRLPPLTHNFLHTTTSIVGLLGEGQERRPSS